MDQLISVAAKRLYDLKPLGAAKEFVPDTLQEPLEASLLFSLAFND
jgi:hypothetical protein